MLCVITDAPGKLTTFRTFECNYRDAKTNARNYYIPLPGDRASNNQIRMQFLGCDRYKGSSSEENSLLSRSRPSFKDYFHVRPSAFRWWKDTRFNQVNATTRPTPNPRLALPPVRINIHVYTSDTYGHVHTWDNFYVRYTLWKRCHRIPTETSNHSFSTRACFLQIGFKKNVRPIFESLFQRMANEAMLSRRAFHVKKNTQHFCALCVFQQILSDVKDDALRDRNVCHDM